MLRYGTRHKNEGGELVILVLSFNLANLNHRQFYTIIVFRQNLTEALLIRMTVIIFETCKGLLTQLPTYRSRATLHAVSILVH